MIFRITCLDSYSFNHSHSQIGSVRQRTEYARGKAHDGKLINVCRGAMQTDNSSYLVITLRIIYPFVLGA